jgi:predicted MFS family arabinose efflux permease
MGTSNDQTKNVIGFAAGAVVAGVALANPSTVWLGWIAVIVALVCGWKLVFDGVLRGMKEQNRRDRT